MRPYLVCKDLKQRMPFLFLSAISVPAVLARGRILYLATRRNAIGGNSGANCSHLLNLINALGESVTETEHAAVANREQYLT